MESVGPSIVSKFVDNAEQTASEIKKQVINMEPFINKEETSQILQRNAHIDALTMVNNKLSFKMFGNSNDKSILNSQLLGSGAILILLGIIYAAIKEPLPVALPKTSQALDLITIAKKYFNSESPSPVSSKKMRMQHSLGLPKLEEEQLHHLFSNFNSNQVRDGKSEAHMTEWHCLNMILTREPVMQSEFRSLLETEYQVQFVEIGDDSIAKQVNKNITLESLKMEEAVELSRYDLAIFNAFSFEGVWKIALKSSSGIFNCHNGKTVIASFMQSACELLKVKKK